MPELTLLGTGSALGNEHAFNSAQILNIREHFYMIDCGEGVQQRLLKARIKTNRINNIFISHLHGDHCFGLLPFISTMSMLNRRAPLTIHAHSDLEKILTPQINYFCPDLSFSINFNHINPRKNEIIFEDNHTIVSTIPLKHSIPTCGFLFEEKPREPHINKKVCDDWNIPLSYYPLIKEGHDFIDEEGKCVKNRLLIIDAEKPKKYAYCSDTAYSEKIIPLIQDVDLLYHETTYEKSYISRAKLFLHSTTEQAALIAKKADVKKLIAGHLSSRYKTKEDILRLEKEIQTIFPNAQIGRDLQKIQF